ncbi:MAG: hypothetical protein JO316_05495 [Abitibacteriaceae bacterium]|nr:hypothetical protein [Abditibacteriaceae bacterium]
MAEKSTALSLKNLSAQTSAKIKLYRWDRIIEKHEGPWDWKSTLRYEKIDFIEVHGYNVLLPVGPKHYKNITILRSSISKDEQTLVIFLKDTTYVENVNDEMFNAGFIAICDKFPSEDFYIATVYHEWFIIDNNEQLTNN